MLCITMARGIGGGQVVLGSGAGSASLRRRCRSIFASKPKDHELSAIVTSRELFVAVVGVAGDDDSPKRLGRRIGLHDPYFPGAIESVEDVRRHHSPYAVKTVFLQYEELADFLGAIAAEISPG